MDKKVTTRYYSIEESRKITTKFIKDSADILVKELCEIESKK